MILRSSFSTILMLLMLTGSFVSCNLNPVDEEQEREIRLVYTDWSESVALTYLSRVLLEQKMGYDVMMKLTDVETAYSELAAGESDVFADAWLPETHKRYFDEYGDKLQKLGIIYQGARTGLVVPEYSNLQSIRDLREYRQAVFGIDSGAGVMMKTRKALQHYDLTNRLKSMQEDKMVRHLQDSVERLKEIVVTGWEPHWIFARYEVRFLEDPDSIFGRNEKIFTLCRKGLEDVHPHAVRFFERMHLSEKQLNSLVYEVRLSNDPVVGVKNWIRDNEYIVNQWVKNLGKERTKVM